MAKVGRPPKDPRADQDVKQRILDWIASGQTLREFCRQEGNPPWQTVYGWLDRDPEFKERFACAREMGQDAIAEETLELVDTEPSLIVGEGGTRYDSAHVQWTKNRIELRLKLLAKWNPKKYGDKVEQTVVGKDGGPVNHSLTIGFVSSK